MRRDLSAENGIVNAINGYTYSGRVQSLTAPVSYRNAAPRSARCWRASKDSVEYRDCQML